MVFLRTYLQLIALLLALDTLIFRSDNSSTSGYNDSLSRAYPNHHLGAIAHFCNTARHDIQPSQGINFSFAAQLSIADITIPETNHARPSHLFAHSQAKVAGNNA